MKENEDLKVHNKCSTNIWYQITTLLISKKIQVAQLVKQCKIYQSAQMLTTTSARSIMWEI